MVDQPTQWYLMGFPSAKWGGIIKEKRRRWKAFWEERMAEWKSWQIILSIKGQVEFRTFVRTTER